MTVWISDPPTNCDLCEAPIKKFFIDGKIRGGPWACMCPSCHVVKGVGLGLGKGQKYQFKASDEQWHKIEG